jgi:hypothetical protein
MKRLAGFLREDPVFREMLRGNQDRLVQVAILLRRVAELIQEISRRDAA